jgi:pimeloyl-ACP methyl ester carboxylesterase
MMGQGADMPETGLRRDAAMRAADGQMAALALILGKITRDGLQGTLPLEDLSMLQIPVHVLWGDQDSVVPVGQLVDAPESFAKTILPDTGHILNDEAPKAVVDAILAHLR